MGAEALLLLRVPLRREECEAWGDGGFEDAEEEADGDGAGEVFDGGEAAEHAAPHDDVEAGVFPEGEVLEKTAIGMRGWFKGGMRRPYRLVGHSQPR